MTRTLAGLAALSCRAVAVPLGPGPPPEQVARAAEGADGLVCLHGDWAGGGAVVASEPLLVLPPGGDPFAALAVQPRLAAEAPELVAGGWFGWLGYDGPPRLAFYDHVLRYVDGDWFFEALWSAQRAELLTARRAQLAALLEVPAPDRPWGAGEFGGAVRSEHLRAVEDAVAAIRAGELYQVNVCTRLAADFAGSAVGAFAGAVAALSPAFGAFVDAGDRALVSLSPELFLRRRGRDVLTAPIKGTAPRAAGVGPDVLRRSAKDAAENVMIVDLMRNDLGRVCETGSVRAAALLDIEPHPGVWHLVSRVCGRLRAEVTDADLLAAAFPPGSVTGAPKLRALDVIAGLEPAPRGAYTGAIGFASPVWGLELSVAIRTFEIRTVEIRTVEMRAGDTGTGDTGAGRIELGVGGGVTADSVPMLEWRECLHKAAPLLGALGTNVTAGVATPELVPTAAQLAGGLLETILAVDGVPLRMADHLARLDRSCRELYGGGLSAGLAERVLAAARGGGPGRSAIRVTASAALQVAVSCRPAPPVPGPSAAHIAADRPGLWRHKWGERGYLTGAEAGGVPLFVAADGTVLETSRGNLFLLCPDGTVVTPPLRDDLLPGVTRRALLDLMRDAGYRTELREFGVRELLAAPAFWTSSLSGAVPIASVDGVPLPRRDGAVAALGDLLL